MEIESPHETDDNTTLHYPEPFDNYDLAHFDEPVRIANLFLWPVAIIVGCFANVLAVVIIIGRHLWNRHEGYFYLAAIFVTNTIVLLCYVFSWFLELNPAWDFFSLSNFTCKLGWYVDSVHGCLDWQLVAFLFNVYLRGILASASERGRCCHCCPVFAAKFCTLLSAKLVTVTLSCVFAIMHVWRLWTIRIIEIGFCHVDIKWHELVIIWNDFITVPLLHVVPFVLLLVLVILIACTRRRNAGVSYEEMEAGRNTNSDFERTSIVLGTSIFIIELPLYILFMLVYFFDFYIFTPVINVFSVFMILGAFRFALIPVVCILLLAQLREEVASKLPRKCRHINFNGNLLRDRRSHLLIIDLSQSNISSQNHIDNGSPPAFE